MAANTANLRVLVTRADGSQYVEEVKDDLGLKRDDATGIAARLEAQGVSAAKASTRDSAGDLGSSFTAGSTGDKLFGAPARAGENAPLGRVSRKMFTHQTSISLT